MIADSLARGGPRLPPRPGFRANHPWDRNFFLVLVLAIWAGVLLGFVPEIVRHMVNRQRPFPPIVHVHGVVFVGWLALLTVQLLLIRTNNRNLHKRLGLIGAFLVPVMLVVGLATAYVMDRLKFGTPDDNTPFLFVQTSDMVAFGVLAVAGLVLRNSPAAHKRLMLLATIYISDAGFSRWTGDPIVNAFSLSYWPYFAGLYLGSDLLVLALGAYDWITRRRLHPAYAAALVWIVSIQLVSVHFRWDPAWHAEAAHLLGH